MSTSKASPLALHPRLASVPKNQPRYASRVQLSTGESLQVADPKATRAMVALMDMAAFQGGAASHYGGPAAFAELMSATHGLMFSTALRNHCEWHDAFHFVNDAGHCENGLYALKANYGFADLDLDSLMKFRSIESALSGHGEAHLFPQGVLVSNGPLGSGLPQAQGLAISDALTGKKRITVCALSDGAAMEGEAKEALAAIPGLAKKGRVAPFVLLISDNRTKLSGRIDHDAFPMEPTFLSLEKLGWHVIRLEDGHNLQACVSTIEEAFRQVGYDPTVPVAIHANTVKGKGTKKTEGSSTGAHGFPLKKAADLPAFLTEIYEGQPVPAEFMAWAEKLQEVDRKKAEATAAKAATATTTAAPKPVSEKIQVGIAAAMVHARRSGLPVMSVSADLQGSTGVAEFHKEFPMSVIDVGVAEANMISVGAGLSIGGYIPVVDTFAQFGVTKGALPITMANLSHGPVIGVFSHTGFQDAADGASHQALSFYAQVSAIPHVEVYSLSCSSEAEALLGQAITGFAEARKKGQTPPTRIFFLGRENFPRRLVAEDASYTLGEAQVVFDNVAEFNAAITFAVSGSLVPEAIKAAEALKAKGIGAIVIHNSAVNHPDVKTVSAALRKTQGRLVTVEEHRLVGGMGAMLCHALLLAGESFTVKSLGVGNEFGQSAYAALDLYKKHGLDSQNIVKVAETLL